jgi:hypothetical protein
MASCVLKPDEIDEEAFSAVTNVVRDLRQYTLSQTRKTNVNMELELRFGNMDPVAWNQLVASLELFERWTTVKGWRESVDFFYDAGELGTVRTTRFAEPPSAGEKERMKVIHIRKQKINQMKLKIDECRIFQSAKLILSAEETLEDADLPESVETNMVRIKVRKTFVWNEWLFDCTKSWRGVTYTEAKKKQELNDDTSFEFEIELLDPAKVLHKSDHTDDFVSACIVLRIVGVTPDQSCAILKGP